MRPISKLTTAVALLTLAAGAAVAQPNDGLKVIESVYNRPQPKDQEGTLTMTLINSRNEERVREIRQFLKKDRAGEKKIMFFLSPADVRNTSFMNWSYTQANREDDQWIYLPALRRTRRVSGDGKSDYFMGSDFTYDDLGDRHPSDDTHKLLREESIDGKLCYVVESVPKQRGYLYSKTITWVDKESRIGVKKEFYDESGAHLKSLSVKKVETIGGYRIITESEMHNVQKKHRTKMEFKELKVDRGVADSHFSERTMMRGL